MKRIVYSVLAASAAAAVMSGCSASEIVNTGGDTKCKDFLTQDEKKQNDEVSEGTGRQFNIQAVATELLLRQYAARLLPLIHRQCLRNHRNRPVEFGVIGDETVWRTGKDPNLRVLSGSDYC